MAKFVAKIKDAKNTIKTVTISATSVEEAKRQLRPAGKLVSIDKKVGYESGLGLTHEERQLFFSRLAAMLMSRMGTSDALVLLRDTFPGRIQAVSEKLVRHVEKGNTLGDAFYLVGDNDFPESTLALIKAGAQTGETYKAIKTAAVFEKELHEIKKGAISGFITAFVSFLVAVVCTGASALYLGPYMKDSPLLKNVKDLDTSFFDAVADITGYSMMAILAILVIFFLISTVGKAISPVKVDRFILKIPFYKDLVLARYNFITLHGLQLLIRSGVKLEEALRITGEGSNKGALREDLLEAASAVKKGKQWSTCLSTFHPIDRASLKSAVDRTQVADTLFALSDQYREIYSQRMQMFIPALQLMAAIFLVLAGAILFGQTILPILMAASKGLG